MSITSVIRLLLLPITAVLLFSVAERPAKAQTLALNCTISMSSVAYGSIDVLPGNSVSTNGSLSISCLNVTAMTGSLYVCVAFPPRSMQGSSATLAYDFYGPSPSTTSWSNTTPIIVPFASLALNQTFTFSIVSAVLAGQSTVPPGNYSQPVTATASYGSQSCTQGFNNSGTFSFVTSATVIKSCNVSATNLNFGAVGDLNTVVDGQSTLSLQCTRGTGYTIGLDGGLTGAASPTARKMTAGTGSIMYGLYQNSARSMPWGTASASLGGTGTATTQAIPVYGRVPVQTTPSVGTYSDTIVATVTY